MRERVEHLLAWLLLKGLGLLPRRIARSVGAGIGRLVYWFHGRLRRVGMFNLGIAFPEMPPAERRRILKQMYRGLGWMLAEFAHFPRWTLSNAQRILIYEGFENFQKASQKAKGVIFFTAHFGAWELSAFAHALYGYPVAFLNRPLDNRRVDELINRYRCLSGCQAIDKNESARTILKNLRAGGGVGILADQNMQPAEGVFVPFFGVPACTTGAIARIALKTGAAVLPSFVFWDQAAQRYKLRFEPEVEMVSTGNEEADAVRNTARLVAILEQRIREHPGHWLWVHKRWHTRPPGEKPLYPF
jgi:KDO2-lipid IV(A) lauroyltransferase